jgi:L-fuconolactonase
VHVDSHVHFWDTSALSVPWLTQAGALNRAVLPSDLPANGSDRWVCVEAGAADPLAEAEWLQALAGAYPQIAAIVAALPLDTEADTHNLLAAYARIPLVTGVRAALIGRDTALITGDVLRQTLTAAGAAGFSVDLTLLPEQMPVVAALIASLPHVTFVIDHAANPDIAGSDFAYWSAGLREMAGAPNVYCKLSGLTTRAAAPTERLDESQYARITPYLHAVMTHFGAHRVLFGSDFPVLTLASDRAVWMAYVERQLDAYSAIERDAVMAATASDVYRFGKHSVTQ